MNSTTATLDHEVVSKSRMAAHPWRFSGQGKGADAAERRAQPPAPRTSLDAGREGIRVRGAAGQNEPCGSVRRAKASLPRITSCSGPIGAKAARAARYVTDHLNGMLEHLGARDVALVLVSRGPLEKLDGVQAADGLAACRGFRRAAAISIAISAYRSARQKSPAARRRTTSARPLRTARKIRA